MPKKIEISHRTIIFTVFFLLALWFLYFIRDIIFAIFVSVLLMAILNPAVVRLTKWKIPKGLAIFLTYVLVIGLFVFAIAWIIPSLASQTTSFVNNIPYFINNLGWGGILNSQFLTSSLTQIGTLPGQAVKFGVSVFSNIVSVLSVLVLSFYFLLYRAKLDEQIGFVFGEDNEKKVGRIIDNIELSLGSWARGELILMLFVGTLTYLGLLLLGIPLLYPWQSLLVFWK